jgi:hypothetical protein
MVLTMPSAALTMLITAMDPSTIHITVESWLIWSICACLDVAPKPSASMAVVTGRTRVLSEVCTAMLV